MPSKESPQQKKTIGRVMHEFKHGELRSRGSGPKVKSPKQAIAIALHEAGASKRETPAGNRRNLKRTKAIERRGETGRAQAEGRSGRSGARGGKAAQKSSARRRSGRDGPTRAQLYLEARKRNIAGRSHMTKAELERAVEGASGRGRH